MTDHSLDRRFLEELVRRADAATNQRISGADVCETIGEQDPDVVGALVARLLNRHLVERTAAPKRLGDDYRTFDIRPTDEAYRIVGHGLYS